MWPFESQSLAQRRHQTPSSCGSLLLCDKGKRERNELHKGLKLGSVLVSLSNIKATQTPWQWGPNELCFYGKAEPTPLSEQVKGSGFIQTGSGKYKSLRGLLVTVKVLSGKCKVLELKTKLLNICHCGQEDSVRREQDGRGWQRRVCGSCSTGGTASRQPGACEQGVCVTRLCSCESTTVSFPSR